MFEFLAVKYDNLETQIITEDKVATAVIFNPHTDNNITVEYRENEDSCEEYTVRFATQCRRFSDMESVVNHIDKYIAGELFAIEFYKDGKGLFGGNILAEDIRNLTAERLAHLFCYSADYIVDMEFRIRGWSGDYDINGRVLRDEKDSVSLSLLFVNNTKKTAGFKEILAYEKSVMAPVRFRVNYIITPVYLIVSFGLMIAFGVLMDIDEVKYLPYGLMILGFFVLITIGLLISVPLVRRREILYSLSFYDFDETQADEQDTYDYSTDEHSVVFDKYGMNVDVELFWYNHMKIFIDAQRYMQRILVSVVFCIDDNSYCQIPLSGTSIKMLRQFGIRILNPDVLEKITSDPYKAFETIYKKGEL